MTVKEYAVQNIGSRELLSDWTTDRQQAERWADESESDDSQPETRIIDREQETTAEDWENAIHCTACLMQEEELRAWCEEHAGEEMLQIVSECPPCQDWYPEVDADGYLTGEIIHAQDEGYTMFRGDDRSQCLVRK